MVWPTFITIGQVFCGLRQKLRRCASFDSVLCKTKKLTMFGDTFICASRHPIYVQCNCTRSFRSNVSDCALDKHKSRNKFTSSHCCRYLAESSRTATKPICRFIIGQVAICVDSLPNRNWFSIRRTQSVRLSIQSATTTATATTNKTNKNENGKNHIQFCAMF